MDKGGEIIGPAQYFTCFNDCPTAIWDRSRLKSTFGHLRVV
jgi:hypothetical protein